MTDAGPALRIEKWLWYARFYKSRSQAARAVAGNRVRLNGRIVSKTSTAVRPGDVLTFAKARQVKVVRVLALGTRRGPAPEARTLYEDLSDPPSAKPADAGRPKGAGRPTKAERRAIARLRGR